MASRLKPKIGDGLALQDALEREAATRKVLEIVGRSRADERPVFDVILESAARLCDAPMARLLLVNDRRTHYALAAWWGEELRSLRTGDQWLLDEPHVVPTAIREARAIHVEDLADDDLYRQRDPVRVRIVEAEGIRSYLAVPLISGDAAIGCIALSRREVKPFVEADIALIETFASQAVIAIENVRQFRELQTRLEREAATREILQVISRSRDDEGPVFEVILASAARLCDAPMARLHLADAERMHFHLAAAWGEKLRSIQPGDRYPLDGTLIVAQTILESRTIHLNDLAESQLYRDRNPIAVRLVEEEGVRTRVTVPLVSGGAALGCITLSRREVAPFSDDQIALVETFAAQAVIAIENVRQFRELQTRLQREAATREILEVISRNRDDEQPVFETILKSAARLCEAPMARLHLVNDDRTSFHTAAFWGDPMRSMEVGDSWPLDPANLLTRTLVDGQTLHLSDQVDTDWYRSGHPVAVRLVEVEGIRSRLSVPLMRGGVPVGAITLSRREVKPFAESQIALVETFAAQAVIAIENGRQLQAIQTANLALQTRLEREVATSNILEVISRSRDDEHPVFDVIFESLMRLCNTPQASLFLVSDDEDHLEFAASRGPGREALDQYRRANPIPLSDDHSFFVRAFKDREPLHVNDAQTESKWQPGEDELRDAITSAKIRSTIMVPLVSGQECLGVLAAYRTEIKPFTDDEIALHRTFAAQAVIAIENVRQFKTLEARTAEVQALNDGLEARVEEQVGEIERMGRLKRFMPAAVADAVVLAGDDNLLSSHRALIAVLFCDIRGFTAFCETAEPEETIEVLQSYHEEMGKLIAAHGAGVDHRMGDGIMVLFNDPLPCENPAGNALRLALAMRARMAELCRGWKRLGHRLGFGVGISLGYATVGMVGSEGRYEYTASGTAVNLAARLCDEAEDGDILLSPRAYAAVDDDIKAESAGDLSLKGIQTPVEVFRVLST